MKNVYLKVTFALFLLSCFSGIRAQITGTISIGTASSTTSGLNWHPIYRSSATSAFDYSRAAFLYDAAELSLAGIPAGATITAIEWDKSNNGATVSSTAAIVFNILMKNSAASTYTGATAWAALSAGATAVYGTTAQVIPATIGNLNFSLSTPFIYTGSGLEILTDWDISAVTGNPSTGGISWNGGANTNHVLGTSNSTILTGTTSLAAQTSRPNIRIIYSYVPLPNDVGLQNLMSPLTTGCYGASENVIVTLKNYGGNSQTNVPVTVIVSGAVSQTLNTVYAGPIASGGTATVNVGTLNMTAVGTYSFNGSTSLAGDGNSLNDAMPSSTRSVIAPAALPQAVNFTGFTGANLTTVFPNWYEAAGVTTPTGVTSVWTSQTGLNGVGNITARLNLFGTARNEWIVGPKFTATSASQISFDAAVTNFGSTTVGDVMGSDDMVRVMVSTNCGASYVPVYTVSATNSLSTTFTNFVAPLGAYAGQDIIVAFLAQDGPIDNLEDYDFHLDNINLYNSVANDAGVQALTSPATNGCYGASENLVVTIQNYGSASISNIPVTVIVSGAATQTTNGTYTGTIIGGGSASFTVGTLNMLAAGAYSFNANTSLPGDLNTANDAMTQTTRIVTAPVALPQAVSFTGFTGANLTAVFPNWYEAAGATAPTGTISNWLNQTGLNGAGNITARINLYTTSRNEWIVGPKFSATAGTQLSFDAAVTDWNSIIAGDVMGSDDKVRVMVSTDCGLSYSPIFTISATNSLTTSFTNFSIPLSAYAGQDIIIAFLAQDGPVDDLEDYDFHLENINLFVGSASDAGISALAAPTATACFTSAENVVVDIMNYGVAAISNVPVTVNITGPIPAVLTGTYVGSIGVGATVTFTVGTANLSAAGIYTFSSVTGLAGDANTFNDGNIATLTVTPLFSVAGNPTICAGNSGTFTASGSATSYSWSTGATTNSIVVSPTVNTTYTVMGINGTCSLSISQTIAVTNPTITSTGAIACAPSGTGTLTANGFSTVNWYASPTATTSLATGNSYVPPTATTSTTYYAEAQSSATGSIQTLFTGGNGCGGGNMFDITPTAGAIQIDSLDVNTSVAMTNTFSVMVFYKTGGYLGNETTASAWTAWDTITVVSAGAGNPSRVLLASPLYLPPSLHALYISYGANYTNGTNAYTNPDLTIQTGAGLCSNFGGVNAGRMFNGNIYYTKPGCTSPRVPVTLTITTCTGIEQLANSNGVVVYPNPAKDEVTVFVSSVSKHTKLKVYNALGQLVLAANINDNTTKINISDLSEGIYIYRVEENETVIKQGKLIKD